MRRKTDHSFAARVAKPPAPRHTQVAKVRKGRPAQHTLKKPLPSPARLQTLAAAPPKVADKVAEAKPSPTEPLVTVIKPLGYVEKADGSAEAVVSQGNRVWLVHQGEIFDDHYRVLKVSSSAVRVAEVSHPQAEPLPAESTVLAADRPEASDATAKSPPVSSQAKLVQQVTSDQQPVPESPARQVLSTSRSARALDSATESKASLPIAGASAALKPIGYVQFSGGPVQDIVEEEHEVKLIPQTEVLAQKQPGDLVQGSTVANAPQVVGASSSAGFYPALAPTVAATRFLADGPSASKPLTFRPDPAGSSQPFGRAVNPKKILGGSPPRAGPSNQPSEVTIERDLDLRVASDQAITADSSPDTDRSPPPKPLKLKAICYVQKADGSVEGVVARGNRAYLVREGDVFADRYRVKRISSSTIQVVDELSAEGLSPPEAGALLAGAQKNPVEPLIDGSHSPPAVQPVADDKPSWGGVSSEYASLEQAIVTRPILAVSTEVSEPTPLWSGTSTTTGEMSLRAESQEGSAQEAFSTSGDLGKLIENASDEIVPQSLTGLRLGFTRDAAAFSGPHETAVITPLPLEAGRWPALPPEEPLTATATGNPAIQSVRGLSRAAKGISGEAGGGRAGKDVASVGSSGARLSSQLTTRAGGMAAPGYGLLLDFSFGDNTCNLPR